MPDNSDGNSWPSAKLLRQAGLEPNELARRNARLVQGRCVFRVDSRDELQCDFWHGAPIQRGSFCVIPPDVARSCIFREVGRHQISGCSIKISHHTTASFR